MKIAFMTLGCPNWNLDTICARGREYGFDGVDFRGYLDEIDITKLPMFTTGATETRKRLDNAGLEVSAISSSIQLCQADKQEANLDEAKRTIEVANKFGCQNVRVFGGGSLEGSSQTELAKWVWIVCGRFWNWTARRPCTGCLKPTITGLKPRTASCCWMKISNPAFGALWDMGHTARVGGETPEQSYAAIGSRIGYTHVKDAVYDPNHPEAMADGWHYVLPGEGQLPLAEAIGLLRGHGYDGWILFEHEKRWHPDLAEPEVAFPAFVKWVRPLFSS